MTVTNTTNKVSLIDIMTAYIRMHDSVNIALSIKRFSTSDYVRG